MPGPAVALALPLVVVEDVLLPLRLGEVELGSGDRRKARSSSCDPMMGRSARPGVYGLHRESL